MIIGKIKNIMRDMVMRKIDINLSSKSSDELKILLGKYLIFQNEQRRSKKVQDYEFKIFSQFGDDGIIQYLIRNTEVIHTKFIEFGVENYNESNTRFLMMNNNWSGYVLDGSKKHIEDFMNQPYFWQFDLRAVSAFITKENINNLLNRTRWTDIGLLSIDIDGNDYWVWKELDISVLRPTIVIIEYNSVFGQDREIAIPYKKDFHRTKAHFSNLYFGASLPALVKLSEKKGYSFICCNSAGNNAYFIKSDRLKNIQPCSIEKGYVESKFRESVDKKGKLTLVRGKNRMGTILGLPVLNVNTNEIEKL